MNIHRTLRTLGAIVAVIIVSIGCQSTPRTPPVADPYSSGVTHFDVAFALIQDESTDELVSVYSHAARRFTETSRLDRAEAVLRSMEQHIQAREAPLSLSAKVDRATSWHALAGADETHVPTARQFTVDTLDTIRAITRGGGTEGAALLRRILNAQLENPNLEEDSVRRTIDEMYLIDDDTVRVDILVHAAESFARLDDDRTLNPVVQQGIAVLPIIEPSLTATSLGIRLSVLSHELGRDGDVTNLVDQAMQRAGDGLIVDQTNFYRLQAIIDGVLHLASFGSAELPAEPTEILDTIVANVSPQSMRVRGAGAIAIDAASDRLDQVFTQMLGLTDNVVRATVTAEFIRKRARRYVEWSPNEAVSQLLGSVTLSGMELEVRVNILSDLAAAHYFSGDHDEFNRLRGLIGSVDEYNRVLLTVAELMEEAGKTDDVRFALNAMTEVPSFSFIEELSPRFRTASIYRRLGEYNRAVAVSEGLEETEAALFLVSLPADFLPNPVSNSVLDRIARR